ncbi:putative ABC transport system permease protein [Thermosyntropha lipolytica DSM 11003]|uniref:Putative ABC transport system permease protein n=1 Tax=Thermosyntropha lipolytica DSM 11003 TaxID=1123382 RepID=A0A1M5JDK6_9FIRM|nr:FtsX-like permease family protein [Thermosyntropha lipolytica]SHG38113.1 putative ABC transport system permease protein [Thermosyntropha lipolytica DSM 11003]
MIILLRKLRRTIWKTRGQFLAMVAVIAIGISIYISINTAFHNLTRARDIFYQDNNFADYYFQVIRAPEEISQKIEALPEVKKATGRIQQDVAIIKRDKSRATARLTSYNLPLDNELNRIQLLQGRFFEAAPRDSHIEAMIDSQYYTANHLTLPANITIIAQEKKIPLTVVGTATGPEFTYIIKDAGHLFPQPQTFAILMLPTRQAQKILGLDRQINQVLVQFHPGIDEKKAVSKIEKILEPYGYLTSFPRSQQLSHAALQGELDGLLTTSRFLPLLFLLVAAAIQFVLLRRMITRQRREIGILKALGYSNRKLIIYFTGYALAVSVLGVILGIMLGLLFAASISDLYAQFFNLPAAIGGINLKVIIYSILLSLGVGIAAGFSATRSLVKINPAEAMRPKPPGQGYHTPLEKWRWLWQHLSTAWKISIRTAFRNRMRSLVTFFGVTIAVALLVVSFFMNDAIDYMLDKHFNQEIKYDLLVRFSSPVGPKEIIYLESLDGISRVEPFMEIPVKITFHHKSADDIISGIIPESRLKTPVDNQGHQLTIPQEGILLSEKTAQKLGVKAGDKVTVEILIPSIKVEKKELTVIDLNYQLMGQNSFVSLSQAQKLLDENHAVNGALLQVEEAKIKSVEQELSDITGITSIISRQEEKDNIMSMLDSVIYFVGIMLTFAIVLGFAIIYNSSVISFTERRTELASLKAMGFSDREIASLILKETILPAFPGIVSGLPLGYIMAHLYVKTVSTDLYSIPVVIYPATYLFSIGGGIIFTLIGHYLGIRRLKELTPAEILKNID